MANPTQTTLSGAITINQTQFNVASSANLASPTNGFMQKIYVLDPGATRGELMTVSAVPASGVVQVSRLSEFKQPHVSGAIVLIQAVDPLLEPCFIAFDPNTVPRVTPPQTFLLDIINGNQWLYSSVTGTWVPGFNNTSAPLACTAAVASVAGVITPSGPLFHVTGTNAITGFTRPTGFTSGSITTIPDNAFTWTTGDGSLAVGGTAVVGKALTFTYDWNAGTWQPSYVA
jgi:hypothetical protein